jgi:parvulin-like peptidyl-prolyl isomerase
VDEEVVSMMKQGILVGLLFFFTLGVAWSASPIKQGQVADSQKVVATVNDIPIYESELFSEINFLLPRMSLHATVSERKLMRIKNTAMANLITHELVYQDAQAEGLKVSNEKIDEEIEKLAKKLEKTISEVLKEYEWTIDQFHAVFEKDMLVRLHYKNKEEQIEKEAEALVTDTFMKDYYNNNKEKFQLQGSVRLREIFFKADSGGGPAHWEEVRQRAIKVWEKINEGEEFAKMAKEHSEDQYAEKGGDMGLGHVGSYAPEIDAAIANLEVGEITGPTISLYGFHLLKVEERAPTIQMSYDEVKLRLRGDLKEKEQKRIWNEWIDSLGNKAIIEYHEEESKKVSE